LLGRACSAAGLLALAATGLVLSLCTARGRIGRASRVALAGVVALSAYGWFAQLGFDASSGRSADAASIALVPAQPTEGAVIVVMNAAPKAVPAADESTATEVTVATTPDTREASVEAASAPSPVATPKVLPAPAVAKPAVAAATQPTGTAVPAATPSARVFTAAEVKSVARQAGWSESLLDDVVAVATCESGLYSGAEGGGALGLMQVMPWWFDKAGTDIGKWSDPLTNLTVARYVYSASGWSAWTCTPPPPHPTTTPDPTPATTTPAAH
jgi:soluble lytic murein transglycosylase-like protein